MLIKKLHPQLEFSFRKGFLILILISILRQISLQFVSLKLKKAPKSWHLNKKRGLVIYIYINMLLYNVMRHLL